MPTNDVLSHDEKIRLLRSLRYMTAQRLVTWENPAKSDESLSRNDVLIGSIKGPFGFRLESADRDDVASYVLRVYRKLADEPNAELVAAISMVPLDEHGDEEVNSLLRDLYAEAARRTDRSDEAISKLFEVIDRIENPPPTTGSIT